MSESDFQYAQRVQAQQDLDEYSDDEGPARVLTPEERRLMGLRQLKIVSFFLCLLGVGLGGFAYYVAVSGWGDGTIPFAVAGLGLLITIMSCMGCCGAVASSHKLLLLNYSCLLFASMATLVAGGFCFILNEQAQEVVKENWEEASHLSGVAGDSADAEQTLQINLYAIGGACFFVLMLLMCAMSATAHIVTRSQAYSLLLQASNMTMLPMGIVLIAAAVFIADTAASADSPGTALGIFIMGTFVCGMTLLGCVSVAISSRGLIKFFMIIVFLLSLAFLGFGVASFVQAETLKQQITNNWNTIRRVLPPTFSGKYDQEAFTRFLEANLNAVGFLTLCVGVLLFTQFYAAMKLRSAIKEAHEEEEDDDPWGEGGRNVTGHAFSEKPRDKGGCCNMQRCWKRNWTKGTTKSRCWVRCGCLCLCLFLILIVGIATSALYFSTSCAALGDFKELTTYKLSTGVVPMGAVLYNNYSRGVNMVTVDTASQPLFLQFEKSALSQGFASESSGEAVLNGNALQFQAEPRAPTKVMGFDISCQQSTLTAVIPDMAYFSNDDSYDASTRGISVLSRSESFVAAEASLTSVAPRLKNVDMETQHGSITLDTVKLGELGAHCVSDSGEIFLNNVNAICNPLYLGDATTGGLRLATQLGGVRVQNSVLRDCELVAKGDASLISISSVKSTTSRGVGALIKVTGEKGLIDVANSEADEFDLQGNIGNVKATAITVRDTLKASAGQGNVVITEASLALRASIQVETTAGSVVVKLVQFAGDISLHSSGVITITNQDSHWAGVTRDTVEKMNSLTANVNCANQGNCAYLGELLVISSTGSITVEIDPWDQTS